MMYTLKKLIFQSPGRYIAALVVAALVVAFRLYTLGPGLDLRFVCYETLSVAGGVTFLVGGLLAVAHFGAFDLFGYVFSPGRVGEVKKYKSYAHYTQVQEEKRSRNGYPFIPFFVVGLMLYLIALLFA